MSPRTKEQNEKIRRTREREILEAARRVFSEKGFHATRMSDIAHAAGVSQGTLYHYFRSKDDLFLALCSIWADLMEAGIRALSEEHMSASDKLSAMTYLAINFFQTDEALMPVLVEFWAYALYNQKATARFRALFDVMQRFLGGILEEGVANGEFNAIDEQTLSVLPLVILDGTTVLAAILGKELVKPVAVVEETLQLVFDGLLAEPTGGEA
jgi:AcrR family transcriptional regulator